MRIPQHTGAGTPVPPPRNRTALRVIFAAVALVTAGLLALIIRLLLENS